MVKVEDDGSGDKQRRKESLGYVLGPDHSVRSLYTVLAGIELLIRYIMQDQGRHCLCLSLSVGFLGKNTRLTEEGNSNLEAKNLILIRLDYSIVEKPEAGSNWIRE
jgi:hypothetical protein